MSGHLYLLQEREFIKTNESIFKIGKSLSIARRLQEYPNGSLLKSLYHVYDIHNAEKALIKALGCFERRTDIGREYFEGNLQDIENQSHMYE